MTDEVATSIERNGFEVRHYVDEASARDAIMKRETYGALLLTEQGPTLLTAVAAGQGRMSGSLLGAVPYVRSSMSR
jgi:hypothetical protein